MNREQRIAALRARKDRDPWRYVPHAPTLRQREFLDVQAEEALFGGAAGGGKSDALLMCALRFVHVPHFSGILFRRTYTDLALPGAIMDRAARWLAATDAHWSGTDKKWTFPSGATLQFGYLDNDRDVYRYQSAEFQFIGFDELTQFPEKSYSYMQSRLRRKAGFPIAPHCRSASNPGGVGHDWVYSRFVGNGARYPFVPSTLADNPHIDAADYKQRLERLDTTTRRQLLDGVWVRDGEGLLYSFARSRNVGPAFHEPSEYVLSVDLGSSEREATTAFCVCGFNRRIPNKVWCIDAFKFAGGTPSSIAEEIKRLSGEYDFTEIIVDQGGLGSGYIREFNEVYQLGVGYVEKKNKLGFRKLMNGAFETGDLMISNSCAELIGELESLQWNKNGTDAEPGMPDHLTDALLYAWRHCRAHLGEEVVKGPDMTTPEGLNMWAEEQLRKERERGLEAQERSWWER